MFVFIFSISLCLWRQQPIKGNFQPGTKRANRDGAESVFSHSESLSLCLFLCLFLCLCLYLYSSQLTSGRGKEEQIETERRVSFSHSQAAED